MFTPGLSGIGSPLKWMQMGERGTVNPFQNVDDRTRIKLEMMGIRPGASITVEQRSPRFTVRIGSQSVVLSDRMIHAVSVRLSSSTSRPALHQRAIAPAHHVRNLYPICELNIP